MLDILILFYLAILPKTVLSHFRVEGITLILLTNLIFSTNPMTTLTWSLHLLLYFLFVQSLSIKHLISLKLPLLIATTFQLILSIAQLARGHALQGPLYYLGERMVAVGQPGVALATFMDQVILRAYGTFSHPNILAGWLVISLLIIMRLKPSTMYYVLFTIATTLGIFLTQSHSSALALFGLIIPLYFLKYLRLRLLYFAALFTLAISYFSFFLPPRADLSIGERLSLQTLSLDVIKNYPVFGTGASASISTYPMLSPSHRLLQPDHNSFTLFLSWFGAVGVLVVVFFVSRLYGFTALLIYIIPVLPLFLLDHYLLTSPQGLLILLIYLKVVNYSHVKSRRQ